MKRYRRWIGSVMVIVAVTFAVTVGSVGPARAQTVSEQQGHHGADTFSTYHNASGVGPRVNPGQWVSVSCKVFDPTITSVSPDGYWYRLADSPWNDQFYAAANTFMNGDPWNGPYTHNTDFSVPDCGATVTPAPPSPPSPPSAAGTPVASLTQGPPAPAGYYYSVAVTGFSPSATLSVSCYDTVSPAGFRTSSLQADGAGDGQADNLCYSGDGPDHWVVVNGIESNHVEWSSAVVTPGGGGDPGTTQSGSTTSPGGQAGRAAFYSGTQTPGGVSGIDPADLNVALGDWASGGCDAATAVRAVSSIEPVSTLAGWSRGRLGPIYYLYSGGGLGAAVHRIVLFDPGSTSDFAEPSPWANLINPTCDWRYDINGLLANWLKIDPQNELFVFTGKDSEEKDPQGHPTYAGLWKYYFAGIWNQSFANQAVVCDFDDMGHEDVLRNFYAIVRSSEQSCPAGPSRTVWNP